MKYMDIEKASNHATLIGDIREYTQSKFMFIESYRLDVIQSDTRSCAWNTKPDDDRDMKKMLPVYTNNVCIQE